MHCENCTMSTSHACTKSTPTSVSSRIFFGWLNVYNRISARFKLHPKTGCESSNISGIFISIIPTISTVTVNCCRGTLHENRPLFEESVPCFRRSNQEMNFPSPKVSRYVDEIISFNAEAYHRDILKESS